MHARLFLAGIGLVTALAVAIVACGGGASPAPSLNLPTLPPNATAGPPSVSVSLPIGSASIPPLPSGVVVPSGAALPSGIDMTKAKSVQLTAQNNSGATGAAFVADLGNGQTFVLIGVSPAVGTNYPASIHSGSCAALDPTAKWTLTNVVNGVSQTTLAAAWTDVTSGTSALVLEKSPQEMQTAVACGDIK